MRLNLFLYFFLYLGCTCAQAQEPNYLFHRLGVKDGLFEETVHAVQQDAKGFLWLNLRTLIQRYDGSRMLSFYQGAELPDGNIRSMVMDKKNRLWLLSGDATLGYLNPESFKYQSVKVNIPKGFNHIVTAMYLNRNGEVMLVWDKQGFITYTDKTGVADAGNNPFSLPQGWGLIHLWQDENFNYWTGTVKGLVKFNSSKKTLSYAGHNEDNDPAINAFEKISSVNSVYVDRSKNCWIITWEKGLKILSHNINSGKQTDWTNKINSTVNKYYVPFGFTETSGNEVWLSGTNLFCKINTADETIWAIPQQSSAEYSIQYDLIFSLYEDKEKNIWAGTNKGLFRFNPNAQLFTIMANRRPGNAKDIPTEITDFLETTNGELLVSTWGSGIFSYNNKLQPAESANLFPQKLTEGTMTWSMIQRPNGDVWCGMQNGALFIFEAATKKFIHTIVPLTESKTIRQVTQDRNGNIWLGTHGGAVIEWNAAQQTFTKHLQVDALISRIYADSANHIWAGTDRDGLYLLNSSGKVLHHYTSSAPKNKKLLINGVADILQYNDSTFYIAGNGLSILNTKTNLFQYYTVAKGLPSANISNLLKDKKGHVWMTSGAGIISYHPEKSRLSYYDARDGIPNYTFNGGAACILKNGNIVFGTNRDFLFFNPDSLTSRDYLPPKIYITGAEIMGESKNVDSLMHLSTVKLNPGQNSFRFFISTLQYKDQYLTHYMLEGIDKTWKKTNKANIIEYNYLPAGKYKLKLAGLHEDGSPGEITSLTLHIAAPFYRQWWFFILLILCSGFLLFWLDHQRIKRKDAVQKMRANIAHNLHEEVNTALGNINILSEMAKMKAGTDPQKSKEFIEQIHSKSHYMMIAMDDMLWSIHPENDSMLKTIERMKEYIEALNNRHGLQMEMIVDKRAEHLELNMQVRHDAFILFKETIKTMAEAWAKNCQMHLGYEKEKLLFTIQVQNDCCDIKALTTLFQRRDLEERIKAIDAVFTTEVHKSVTVFLLKIPV